MKVSVIISACNNREIFFERSLYTFNKQTLPKNEFEILLIDDGNHQELLELCKKYHDIYGLKFQYVRIDKNKSNYPSNSFTPALTNNVGFKLAVGEVIVITGPETLQAENNLLIASSMISRQECAYGLVFRASKEFEQHISSDSGWRMRNFDFLLNLPGAKAECRTCLPHPAAYNYLVAVNKTFVFQIHGIDERFLEGVCAEDDDFANRMRFLGTVPVFDHRMIGIHQNHESNDQKDTTHNMRSTKKWAELRNHNISLMKENLIKKDPIANKNHEWGNLDTIISKEILY
jgi:glycosyltransferase involved in cell wall biosynthesis